MDVVALRPFHKPMRESTINSQRDSHVEDQKINILSESRLKLASGPPDFGSDYELVPNNIKLDLSLNTVSIFFFGQTQVYH